MINFSYTGLHYSIQSVIAYIGQPHSGSEFSSSSTNGDRITHSDTNANHEPNDKFIFSSTSMEFAVSRKIGKYRQKNVSSDDINGQKQTTDARNNLTGSSSGGSAGDGPDGPDGTEGTDGTIIDISNDVINFKKMPSSTFVETSANISMRKNEFDANHQHAST